MKQYYKLLLLTVLLSLQGFNFQASASVPTAVDSIYSLIEGDWYYVYACNGFSGSCDSVYSTNLNRIERIGNSDTISWKTYNNNVLLNTKKFLINYKQSMLSNSKRWMLSTISEPPPPGGYYTGLSLSFMLYSDGVRMGLAMDAYDGGSAGYARSMRPNSAYHERLDSIANCLRGDWYAVTQTTTLNTAMSYPVYNAPKRILSHIPGSDSITFDGMKYRIYESDQNFTEQTAWMLSTTVNNFSPDGIHVLPVVMTFTYLIYCNNGEFTMQENKMRNESFTYNHSPRIEPLGLKNVSQDKPPFTLYPNPVGNCLQINGSTPIESIQIADIRGHRVLSKKTDSKTLDVSNFPKGIYLVRIAYQGAVQTIKMVKK